MYLIFKFAYMTPPESPHKCEVRIVKCGSIRTAQFAFIVYDLTLRTLHLFSLDELHLYFRPGFFTIFVKI